MQKKIPFLGEIARKYNDHTINRVVSKLKMMEDDNQASQIVKKLKNFPCSHYNNLFAQFIPSLHPSPFLSLSTSPLSLSLFSRYEFYPLREAHICHIAEVAAFVRSRGHRSKVVICAEP